MSDDFGWDVRDGVGYVTLVGAERKNPLTFASYAALRDHFRDLVYVDDVHAIVISGEQGNFSSGGDVRDIIGPLTEMDMSGLLRFTRMTGDLVKAIKGCGKPVIAAVDGVCVGAGAMIATASDMRIGTPRSNVAFLFTRVGLAGCDMGACAMLPRIVGQGRAAELLFTGRAMNGVEGERWGFFNRLTSPWDLAADATKLATSLASGPNFAHSMTKTMLDQEWDMSLPAAIEAEAQAQAICMQTKDFERAYHAFLAKERPVFEGNYVLEWPFFEDRHREFAAWAAEHIPEVSETELDARCRGFVRALSDGWLDHTVADPLDVRTLCLARETLAYHDALADFAFAMQGLGSGPITLFGDDDLKDEYLPAVAAGERIAAFALSEPEAGSDVAAMTTTAQDGRITGTKTWISNGGIADFYTVFARAPEGITAYVVDAEDVEIAERIDVMAPHPLATLAFHDAPARLIGQPGKGMRIALATLDVFRSTVGAAALGFARRALDEALGRVRERELFGAPMAELPLVQAKLAEMALGVDASALLVYRAAWTKDVTGARVTREAAMAKLHATESAQKTIDAAVQLFGGLGVTVGQPVERLYREIRALRIYEGASEVQQLVIGREVLR